MKQIVIISLIILYGSVLHAQEWTSIFPDTALQHLINEALDANSDIRTAKLSIEQSQAMLRGAKLNYLPDLSLAPTGEMSLMKNQRATYTYQLPVQMAWEVNLGGKWHFEKQVAKSQYIRDVENLKHMQYLLISEVSNAYYTLIMLDRQLAISQQSLAVQQKNVEVFRALKEVGLQQETAVNQAEVECQGLAASIPMLRAQIQTVETSLCMLLNRQASTIERPSWESVQGIALDTIDNIPLEQLSNRPDVRAAEYQMQAAFYHVKVVQADFYPSFRISGSFGWTNNLGEIINPASWLLNAIGGLVQPLLSIAKTKAQLKAAKAQQEQAVITFEKTLLIAGGELRDALAMRNACHERETMRQKQVIAAQKGYENNREMMQYSQNSYLEILTAQRAWLDAQLLQTADWLEKQQSMINLYKALCPPLM